jgi:hypothetical protein
VSLKKEQKLNEICSIEKIFFLKQMIEEAKKDAERLAACEKKHAGKH